MKQQLGGSLKNIFGIFTPILGEYIPTGLPTFTPKTTQM